MRWVLRLDTWFRRRRYKIKLRSVGYRLAYQVDDKVVLVTVIAVGRRDRSRVSRLAGKREKG